MVFFRIQYCFCDVFTNCHLTTRDRAHFAILQQNNRQTIKIKKRAQPVTLYTSTTHIKYFLAHKQRMETQI